MANRNNHINSSTNVSAVNIRMDRVN